MFFSNESEFVFGLGFGEEVVNPGLLRYGRGGKRIVARDHDGANANGAETLKAVREAAFDNVFELDGAEDLDLIGNEQRRGSHLGDVLGILLHRFGQFAANVLSDRLDRSFAIAVAIKVHAAHARLGGKGDEFGMRQFMQFTPTQSEFLLRKNDNDCGPRVFRPRGMRAALLRASSSLMTPGAGRKRRGLAVSERNRTRFVQEQHVHIAGGLDGPSAHCEHVLLNEAVDASDADSAKQTANGCRNQTDEQRDQHCRRKIDILIDPDRPSTPSAPPGR